MIKPKIQKPSIYKKQLGMTFIELLVAFVILATGILGAVAMQASAKQSSFNAMQRSIASSLAQDIIAKIRANSAANIDNYFASDYGDNFELIDDMERCDSGTPAEFCTPAEITAADIYEWELALVGADVRGGGKSRGGLIGGQGCISASGNGIEVVVSWQSRTKTVDSDKSESDCGTSGNKTRRQVVVQAFII